MQWPTGNTSFLKVGEKRRLEYTMQWLSVRSAEISRTLTYGPHTDRLQPLNGVKWKLVRRLLRISSPNYKLLWDSSRAYNSPITHSPPGRLFKLP